MVKKKGIDLTTFYHDLFRRFRVNYIINLNKSYIPCGDSESLLGRASLFPHLKKWRLALPLYLVSIRQVLGILLSVFIIRRITICRQYCPSIKHCYFRYALPSMIQNSPFGLGCNKNVKPQKYILAKRFNELTYKILNNKCK